MWMYPHGLGGLQQLLEEEVEVRVFGVVFAGVDVELVVDRGHSQVV